MFVSGKQLVENHIPNIPSELENGSKKVLTFITRIAILNKPLKTGVAA